MASDSMVKSIMDYSYLFYEVVWEASSVGDLIL